MKATLSLVALALAAPVFAQDKPADHDSEMFHRGPVLQNEVGPEPHADLACTDTIHHARRELGLPSLDRKPADPDDVILLRAVHYNLDGCDVLLASDGEILPLPLPQEGPFRPQPAQ